MDRGHERLPNEQEHACDDPLRASANQELHFLTERISRESLEGLPRAELVVRDGELQVTGFHPELSSRLRAELGPKEAPDA